MVSRPSALGRGAEGALEAIGGHQAEHKGAHDGHIVLLMQSAKLAVHPVLDAPLPRVVGAGRYANWRFCTR